MAKTTTGPFPIGFRRGWSEWQKNIDDVISFAKANDFEVIDTGPNPYAEIKKIVDAGLSIGTVDLIRWTELASPDAGKRKAAAAANIEYIKSLAPLGVKNYFTVIMPEDGAKPRKDNFAYAVDGYGQLLEGVKSVGARIAIEGWPGMPPHFSSLACTTADYRALLKELPDNAGVNYDASHLVRVGIDPIRFLNEFASKVVHIHGKDTEILDDELYEHGNLQPATFVGGHGFGGHNWRYTIPGHGQIRFKKIFTILKAAGFKGAVCVELEDENYNGTEAGEKLGLLHSRNILASF